MKKSCCLVFVGVALFLTAPCAHAISLADLITTNGSITVDDKSFSGFRVNSLSALNGATPASASGIDVTGVAISGEEGLRFASNFTAPLPSGSFSLSMSYTVSVLNSGRALSDMTMAGDPSGPANSLSGNASAFLSTSANFTFGGNQLHSQIGLPQTHGDFQTPQTNVLVDTRMDLAASTTPGVPSPASFTFLTETFSQTAAIPEPSTLLLFLTGLIGLARACRLRS